MEPRSTGDRAAKVRTNQYWEMLALSRFRTDLAVLVLYLHELGLTFLITALAHS